MYTMIFLTLPLTLIVLPVWDKRLRSYTIIWESRKLNYKKMRKQRKKVIEREDRELEYAEILPLDDTVEAIPAVVIPDYDPANRQDWINSMHEKIMLKEFTYYD